MSDMRALNPGTVVLGTFKGMGDFLSAAPIAVAELNGGASVVILAFPAVTELIGLMDFGVNSPNLRVISLPSKKSLAGIVYFFRQLFAVSPGIVWVSPHAPAAARSWRVPLFLWLVKALFWRRALLAGAESESLSVLFDVRLPVDRKMPLATREWTAYAMMRWGQGGMPRAIRFRASLDAHRAETSSLDILIHPGANAANRRWDVRHFVELIGLLPAACRVGVVGVPKDVEAMKSAIGSDRQVQYFEGSLEDAIASIARARVLLSMDSGTTFFARALGVPNVALFGPVDPANVHEAREHFVPVYERKWACQPCGDAHCRYETNYCMKSIQPARVAAELLRVLQSTRKE
jgi:lipopolysaccharide heptosyltransferase II